MDFILIVYVWFLAFIILFRIAWRPSAGKELFFKYSALQRLDVLFYAVSNMCVSFPFGAKGRMWNSIASGRDHCLFIYFYSSELQLRKANSDASILDFHLTISEPLVSSKVYDKSVDFDFDIVNFPFLDVDTARATSYGVHF